MGYFDNPPLEEVYNAIIENDENSLEHYGTKRHSGRYPYGSGKDPHQHGGDLLSRIKEYEKLGYSQPEIAKALNIVNPRTGQPSTTRLRIQRKVAEENRRADDVATAERLRYKEGKTLQEITDIMGFKNDSSVRALLDKDVAMRKSKGKQAAEFLKQQVKEKGMIDVGGNVEYELNITKGQLDEALYRLELEGYPTYGARVPQALNKNNQTTIKVLCPPGTEHKEIYNYENIHSVTDYISRDGGETFEKKFHYPASMDSKRLMIRYKEDGGIDQDGIIQLRRGVEDLSLSGRHYSQVRILVDNDRYLKGMAIYGDDKEFPPGVDVIFNTNKTKDVPMRDVLKKIKDDPDNPFGSAIKDADQGGQYWYTDSKTGKKKLGLINKRADEGDWDDWKDKVPSQFLSKQPLPLAKRQLTLALAEKQAEYENIMSLNNPTVKKKFLETFASDCDSTAVHLHAAALPRQKYHVIIPVTSLKDTEIYAPKYNNGEKVALVRYPHGGTFEIPILTVNNRHAKAKALLGSDIKDAVGINSTVAERLSGADFDGDTVMVIPTGGKNKINITSTPQLEGLKGFDPKTSYGTNKKIENGNEVYYSSTGRKVKIMKDGSQKQNEMGRISNLITDMTLRGATEDELAAAVRHSMVIIDAPKHKLDYTQSAVDNHIETLKKKYQGYIDPETGRRKGGASTLISRAKSETSVDKRQGTPKINVKYDKNGKLNDFYDPSKPEGAYIYKTATDLYYPERSFNKKTKMYDLKTTSGKKISYDPNDPESKKKYEPVKVVDKNTGETRYFNKDGDIEYRVKKRTQKSDKMSDTYDARTLISESDTAMERAYAGYANQLKALANRARKEYATTQELSISPVAKKAYEREVISLDEKLMKANKNSPKERMVQYEVNSIMKAKTQANPDMTNEEKKKHATLAQNQARAKYGAKREEIEITPKEWEAIQAGAISKTKLAKILDKADLDKVRELATPTAKPTLTQAKINKLNAYRAKGYTIAEIAKALGVSTSTVTKYIE